MKLISLRTLAVFAALAFSTSTIACGGTPEDALDGVEGSEEATESEIVSRTAQFETFQGLDGQYYFNLVAANGQTTLRSEGYKTLAGAKKGVAAVVTAGASAKNFEVKVASSGDYYFTLKAGNGEIVGIGQLYSTKSNALRGASTSRSLIKVTKEGIAAAPKRERFEVFTGENRQSYFRLRAGNGEIMLSSEGYSSKQAAKNGLASVKENGNEASSFEVFEAADGQYGVRLVAANGETIARGELYASKSNADRAVARLVEILSGNVTVSE